MRFISLLTFVLVAQRSYSFGPLASPLPGPPLPLPFPSLPLSFSALSVLSATLRCLFLYESQTPEQRDRSPTPRGLLMPALVLEMETFRGVRKKKICFSFLLLLNWRVTSEVTCRPQGSLLRNYLLTH